MKSVFSVFLIPSCSLWDPADSIFPYRISSSALFGHFPFFSHPLITKPHYTHYQPFAIFLVFPNLQPSVLSKATNVFVAGSDGIPSFPQHSPVSPLGSLGEPAGFQDTSPGAGCPPREGSFLAPRPTPSSRSARHPPR